MELNYVNKKLVENIFNIENNNNLSNENRIYVFSMYEGYDIYLLLDCLINEIKAIRILGNIYMLNFSAYFIKLMNNNYNINIENITSKNKNEIGKVFSLAD